jgi:hypothetical protein
VFGVRVSSNVGRIAGLAEEARLQNKALGVTDVPERLRAPAVYVVVVPVAGGVRFKIENSDAWFLVSSIDKVLLESKSQPEAVVHPETFAEGFVDWPGKLRTNQAVSSFPIGAVKGL